MLLSFRVLLCFSSSCLETTRASLGWRSPPKPEVKAQHPTANGRERPGPCPPWIPRSALPVPVLYQR